MDSLGPINFQAHAGRVAQAYGARGAVRGGAPVPQSSQGSILPNGVIQPPFPPTRDPNGRGNAAETRQDRVTLSGGPAIPEQIEQLIAGQVDSPVSRGEGFDEPSRGAPARPSAAGVYAMYGRSADRVEVATSVAVGRSLDTRA